MTVKPSKEQYAQMITARLAAFRAIANELGKDHAMTLLMGSLAWGRYGAEMGPSDQTIRKHAEAFGFLNGSFSVLNSWARINDPAAQRVMLKHWRGVAGYQAMVRP